MNVKELRDFLNYVIEQGGSEAKVCFDTEAQTYECHFVAVDSAFFEVELFGEPIVTLHENHPHRGNTLDNDVIKKKEET